LELTHPTVEVDETVHDTRIDTAPRKTRPERVRVGTGQANVDHFFSYVSLRSVGVKREPMRDGTRHPAVWVRDLVIRYGSLRATDGVDLEANAGEVLALLGPNGAGKTSTVEACEGYRRPTSGSVRVLGLDPVADRLRLAPRIGVMLQAGGVYPTMRPLDALGLFHRLFADPLDVDELLDRLELRSVARTPYRALSGGEQQRLKLALALIGRPEVAFLDEPSAGVDPIGRAVIREVVAELAANGVAVVLTTHDLEEAEQLADRIAIIDRGRVVASGSPEQLRSLGAGATLRFSAAAGLDVARLAEHLGHPIVEERPGHYVVSASPDSGPVDSATVAALAAWLADHGELLGDVQLGQQRLEEVFLRLTRTDASTPPSGGRRSARSR
jgi:ABC-2 type transport system ATP-binding protein